MNNAALNDSIPMNKMKVEIWSDIVCPFCYIGKTRLEEALKNFEHRDQVEVIWRSFLLNPDQKTDTTISIHQYLADSKGWTLSYAKQAGAQVTEMAAQSGLKFDFDKVVVASSIRAHQLVHLAAKSGVDQELMKLLFDAYFTEGKNIDDVEILAGLAVKVGISESAAKEVINSTTYLDEINQDIKLASEMGVRGVPFFVYLDKYVVSGAQDVETFKRSLERGWEEFSKLNPSAGKQIMKDGAVCAPDGKCD